MPAHPSRAIIYLASHTPYQNLTRISPKFLGPPLEGGFWSKKAQNPIGELFLGGGPHPRRCVNMDKPLKRELPIHLEYRDYRPPAPICRTELTKRSPPQKIRVFSHICERRAYTVKDL